MGNMLKDCIGIGQDFMIPVTEDLITMLSQERSPQLIGRRLISMLSAVKLHHEVLFWAAEVHNVRSDGMLATKLQAIDLSSP